jgi:hypothetical protein
MNKISEWACHGVYSTDSLSAEEVGHDCWMDKIGEWACGAFIHLLTTIDTFL